MGDRLGRFGFGLDDGKTLTPALMQEFLRQQILSSFATAEGLGAVPGAPKSSNPFTALTSGNSFDLFKQQGSAVNAALQSRGLSTRPFEGAGGFGGLQPVAPRQVNFTEGAFPKEFFTDLFGGNAPNPNSFNIAGLGFTEAQALAALDARFQSDPNLGLQAFRAVQNQADALQKIRDSKVSGGPIGGPLKVASFGLSALGLSPTSLLGGSLPQLGPIPSFAANLGTQALQQQVAPQAQAANQLQLLPGLAGKLSGTATSAPVASAALPVSAGQQTLLARRKKPQQGKLEGLSGLFSG